MDLTFLIGYVASEVTTRNQTRIEIYCPELYPMQEGDISALFKSMEFKVKSLSKKAVVSMIKLGHTIGADFIGNSNHDVPDVVIGERVRVYNFNQSSNYFWEPFGIDDSLRKTEHWRVAIADSPQRLKKLDFDNAWIIEIDTKYKKQITLSTSKSGGELFRYQLVMDGQNSNVRVSDDIGNLAIINSLTNQVLTRTALNSFVNMVGTDIDVFAPRDLRITALGNVLITAGKTLMLTGKNIGNVALMNYSISSPTVSVDSQIITSNSNLLVIKSSSAIFDSICNFSVVNSIDGHHISSLPAYTLNATVVAPKVNFLIPGNV